MTRLVILGGSGAGKSTQAKLLAEHLRIPAISTGEMLRSEIASGSDLGEQAKKFVGSGELVPDDVVVNFIRSNLSHADPDLGWVLEGYPRTAFQAEELDFLLDDLDQPLDWAIYLDVPDRLLRDRSIGRGDIDDLPASIDRRIELFIDRTKTLLDYYDHKNRLLTIDGSQSAELVCAQIQQGIGQ